MARSFWRSSGYFGEAQLLVHLNIQNLHFSPGVIAYKWPSGPFAHFYETEFNSALVKSIASPSLNPNIAGSGIGVFNSALPREASSELTATLINQALRSLGTGVNLNELRRAVELFVDKSPSE
jgi:hypothetical protein